MTELILFFTALGIDLSTKRWAGRALPVNRKKEIVKNRLYFWHIKNKGIAYNKYSGRRKEILCGTGGILALYGVQFLRILRGKDDRRLALPMALLLGGGCGNFLERLKKGSVTDFLYLPVEGKNAPIFNLADVFIWLGAVGMLFAPCRKNTKNAKK